MADEGDLVFVGVAHPPQGLIPPTKDVGVNQFCTDNLRQMKLSGLPIGYEHEYPVGKIIHAATGSQDTKMVVGHIPAEQTDIIKKIEEGQLPDLSLTHSFSVWNEDDGTEIQERQPIEVSLTKKGNRPGCKIIHTQRLSKGLAPTDPISNRSSVQQKMAEEEASAPAMSLADFADKEKVEALGWSHGDMMNAFVEASKGIMAERERVTQLENETEAMRKQKEELEAVSQKQLDELKEQLKGILTPAGEKPSEVLDKALTTFGPSNVEQSEILRMIVQNGHDKQAYINRLEEELQNHRQGVQMAQQAKKNPALAHFSNTISALRNEPLAKTEKRFASEALTEAVDPLQSLRSSFMQKESKMPRMSYQ